MRIKVIQRIYLRGRGKAKNFYFGYCTKLWKYFVSRLVFAGAKSPGVLCMQKLCFESF